MLDAKQFDEKLARTPEVLIERAARVPGARRNVLDALCRPPLFGDARRGSIEQIPTGE
ncbi:hypothetical protein [Burkholderia contaminans]|uniref:hypothetical protein n=1 Tax=Burkholderia contaminans TaxID=488447 RepID=UPI001588B47D|nr:hypothetical protein [Burkholderia contaminans]